MTPKEKAVELVRRFEQEVGMTAYAYSCAKQCALLAVGVIIAEIDENYDTLHSADRKQYWYHTKEEIEKL